jgi:hypothetical protein
MMKFVDAERNKNVTVDGKFVQELGSNLGF